MIRSARNAALLLALALPVAAPMASADPAASASGQVGVTLRIPPRVSVDRDDAGTLCATNLNSNAAMLEVVDSAGEKLDRCGTELARQVTRSDGFLLVTPV